MYYSVHKAFNFVKFLTFIALSLVFLVQKARGDLAPHDETNEESDSINHKADVNEVLNHETTPQSPNSNLGFIHAFIASFSVIIVSEIGDKTFFIAAIMSMVSQYRQLIN